MNNPLKTLTLAVLGILICSVAAFAGAQTREAVDVHALGPQVGESIPAFSLPDQNSQLQSLDSIKGPNGTMLLFHRSADW